MPEHERLEIERALDKRKKDQVEFNKQVDIDNAAKNKLKAARRATRKKLKKVNRLMRKIS